MERQVKSQRQSGITRLLEECNSGSKFALNTLVESAYNELSVQARNLMHRERRGHTLQTRALVHETYMKLLELREFKWQGRQHFFSVAAVTMRRILVDHARSRQSCKRGGNAVRVTLADHADGSADLVDLLALDKALSRLAEYDHVQAHVVELRYFTGLTIAEVAEQLSLSPATVKRKWRIARAWLHRDLQVHGNVADIDPA